MQSMNETTKPIKTIGQRGKDKQPRRKRQDCNVTGNSDDNSRMMEYHLALWSLGKLTDQNNNDEVISRTSEYFRICSAHGYRPAVASYALALGIDRVTLYTWVNGTGGVKNPEVINTLKRAYAIINAGYEDMMNNGKINPVAGIFLMKNNLGYKDQTDHIVTAKQESIETEESLIDRAGLLTD